jgi:stage II sporulation protein D
MRICFLITTLSLFLFQYAIAGEQLVRVRLAQKLSKIELTGYGLTTIPRDHDFENVSLNSISHLLIEKIVISGQNFWQVTTEAGGRTKKVISKKPVLAIYGTDIHEHGRALPNKLLLNGSETFDLVGILPLNNYLVGVVSSEMPLSWPIEALKAQAVAARSYTLALMKERQKQFFHVESSIIDQVFNHVSQEMDQAPLIVKARAAVEATQFLILKNRKNSVVKAFYHSDCGGRTSSSKSVWGSGDLKGGAIDESCPANPKSIWSLKVPESTLLEKMVKFFKLDGVKSIVDIITKTPTDDDRVSQVAFRFDNGQSRTISAYDFRNVVGTTELRSTRFQIQKKSNAIQFNGRGFGHGVGLCQWGTRSLAQQGWDYKKILAHYYPESLLTLNN